MARINDITGLRFGMLIATHMTGNKTKSGNYIWHCRCDCGNEVDVSSSHLVSGHTTSCGCNKLSKLEGMKFGNLTVIDRTECKKHGEPVWNCICSCGNKIQVKHRFLTHGYKKYCKKCGREISDIKLIEGRERLCYNKRKRLYGIWYRMKSRCNNPESRDYKYYGERGITLCKEWESFDSFEAWAISNGYNDYLTIERIDVNKSYCPENCTWIPHSEQSGNRRNSLCITYKGRIIPVARIASAFELNEQALVRYLDNYMM